MSPERLNKKRLGSASFGIAVEVLVVVALAIIGWLMALVAIRVF